MGQCSSAPAYHASTGTDRSWKSTSAASPHSGKRTLDSSTPPCGSNVAIQTTTASTPRTAPIIVKRSGRVVTSAYPFFAFFGATQIAGIAPPLPGRQSTWPESAATASIQNRHVSPGGTGGSENA